MGKNNKNNAQPKNNQKADDKKNTKAQVETSTQNNKSKQPVQKKQEPVKEKPTPTPPPADPTIIEPKVDVVDHIIEAGFAVKDISELKFDNMSRLDANHQAILLQGATEFFKTRDPKSHLTMFANEMLEFDYMYMLARATAQNWQESKEFGLNVPKEKAQFFIDSFNTVFGLALKPAETDDPRQTKLQFDESASDKDTVEQLKRENLMEAKVIERDVDKWENEEMVRDGLAAELVDTTRRAGDSISAAIMKAKLYLTNKAKAELEAAKEEEKSAKEENLKLIESYNVGDMLIKLTELLGKKSSIVVNGFAGSSYSALAGDHCMIFAHSRLRKMIPIFSDEDAVSFIKACIKLKNQGSDIPLDSCLAVKNGIDEPTREFFLTLPVHAMDPDRNSFNNEKKQYNKFLEVFKEELKLGVAPSTDTPDKFREYCLKVANAMLNIRNMYVEDAAKWDPFKLEEYSEYPVKKETDDKGEGETSK